MLTLYCFECNFVECNEFRRPKSQKEPQMNECLKWLWVQARRPWVSLPGVSPTSLHGARVGHPRVHRAPDVPWAGSGESPCWNATHSWVRRPLSNVQNHVTRITSKRRKEDGSEYKICGGDGDVSLPFWVHSLASCAHSGIFRHGWGEETPGGMPYKKSSWHFPPCSIPQNDCVDPSVERSTCRSNRQKGTHHVGQ